MPTSSGNTLNCYTHGLVRWPHGSGHGLAKWDKSMFEILISVLELDLKNSSSLKHPKYVRPSIRNWEYALHSSWVTKSIGKKTRPVVVMCKSLNKLRSDHKETPVCWPWSLAFANSIAGREPCLLSKGWIANCTPSLIAVET